MAFFDKYPYTDFHELNLDWVLKTVKDLITEVDALDEWKEQFEEQYQELIDIYNQLIAGNFPPAVVQAFYNWMAANAQQLVGEMVKLVIFNITDEGYFVAYIPDSWDDIIFGTTGFDLTIPGYDYGHLVLSYNA